MNDITITQLYAEHKGKVSDKWSLYLTEYDRIFGEYWNCPVKVLEIGVQNGGSLEIWSKYFQKGKKFIGCDINPKCSKLIYEDPRIALVIGDANTDSVQVEIFQHSSEFDIIIDDGSHLSGDIVKSFVRYFPAIMDGGMFVVEDLHCSYWYEFEGGLFDPFSSMTFFKHLSDIINHEHWGVDKKRTDLLKGFFTKYGVELNEDLLKQVHSIEFINSICVIRKSSTQKNLLGDRRVVGTTDEVFPNLQCMVLEVPSQTHSLWSSRELPPSEELPKRLQELSECGKQVGLLSEAVAERDSQIENLQYLIEAMRKTLSWRITSPLRYIKSIIIKILHRGKLESNG